MVTVDAGKGSFCLGLYLTRFIGFCLEEQQNFCLEGSQHSLLLINANTLSAHLLVQEVSSLVVLLKGEILWTWLPYCPLNRGAGEQERRTNIHLFIETSLQQEKSFGDSIPQCKNFFPLFIWFLVAFAIMCLRVVFFVFVRHREYLECMA